ncbi:unnamed protein product [Rhizoctonia solani]|uniref:Cutinase n=1 Tax=Rhizoctonia solani TaxID=456999 RepID=A0A8H2WIK4_9AGAM|nr:unnamed protein product [Rhizoctonia solani]
MFFNFVFLSFFINAVVMGSPIELETRQLGDCSPVLLIHAAGTTEVGLGTVGIPLSRALASAIPGTTSYAVPYSTSAEYFVTVQAGVNTATAHLTSEASRCPNQKYILSGYSKGAMVVRNMRLSPTLKSRVISILVFGDPLRGVAASQWPIDSPAVNLRLRLGGNNHNVASFCNASDMFCTPPCVPPPHLAYPMDRR